MITPSGENVAHDSVEHGVLCFGEFGFHLFARQFGFDRLSRRCRLMGMKQILVMMAAVVLVGCGESDIQQQQRKNTERMVLGFQGGLEGCVRRDLQKLEGELTDEDYGKVTQISFGLTGREEFTDKDLEGIEKCINLKRAFLQKTKISDEGLKELAKLQKLETLYLYGTMVTKEGVAELKKALPNCEISY